MDRKIENRPWTDEERNKCIMLAKDGLSGSRIAAILSRRRNSIVGFLFRKKVPLMGNNKANPNAPKKLKPIQPKKKQPSLQMLSSFSAVPDPPMIAINSLIKPKIREGYGPVSMLDVRSDQCKWVIKTATNSYRAIYCGEPIKKEGCSWCTDHYKIVFVPRTETQRPNSKPTYNGWNRI